MGERVDFLQLADADLGVNLVVLNSACPSIC